MNLIMVYYHYEKYFLVEGTITKTPYMGDSLKFDTVRLVIAKNEDDAKDKFQQYWENKSESYSVSYWASCEVLETIS